MVGYPGSKAASGVVQRIISLMPRHEGYVEPFLGGGFVLDTKRPSAWTIAADLDADLMAYHRRFPVPGVEYKVADAFELLPSLNLTRRDLVYMDPPYHPETRSRPNVYRFELDDAGHLRILTLAKAMEASVMLSGYRCPLYDRELEGWHREDFRAGTRGGVRIESVWCNFRPGESFHDVRFAGRGFRERERIKRKRRRWAARFAAMPAIEKAVIWEAMEATLAAEAAGAARPEAAMPAPPGIEPAAAAAAIPAEVVEVGAKMGIIPVRSLVFP